MFFSNIDLVEFLYIAVPVVTVALFIAALVLYLTAARKNKKSPGTYSPEQMRSRLIFLVITSVIAGTTLVVVVGFAILLFMAVAFM